MAKSYLTGEAELSFTDYKARWEDTAAVSPKGTERNFSGNSLTQKYSATWMSSNLFTRAQERYYDLLLGYDIYSFGTRVTDDEQNTAISDTFGKLRYSGEIGFNPRDLPVKLSAYTRDNHRPDFRHDIASNLLNDGLTYNILGKFKSNTSGVTFEFDPETSRSPRFYGLPKFMFDYRDSYFKSGDDSTYKQEFRTRELAVAGLNKQNNWLQYRALKHDDYLSSESNYQLQQILIGHIDNLGQRKWSALTNWINVSADGQLTTIRSKTNSDQYDINFMAIATRRSWEARSFMNYNRNMIISSDFESTMTERARLPLYLKGIYGSEASWYTNVSFEQGRKMTYGTVQRVETDYSNNLSAGGIMFTRSKFNLAPSVRIVSSRTFNGGNAYEAEAAVETNSTARFSRNLSLAARNSFTYTDDGAGAETSKTWFSNTKLNGNYREKSHSFSLTHETEVGEKLGAKSQQLANYMKFLNHADYNWNPVAEFNTSLSLQLNLLKYSDDSAHSDISVEHRIIYDKRVTSASITTRYRSQKDSLIDSRYFSGEGLVNYRPDRYTDASLRYLYDRVFNSAGAGTTRSELIQKHTRNFYSSTGVIRNIASLWQQYEYKRESSGSSSQSLTLGGRYSPTDKLSLYGSGSYTRTNPLSVTMIYNMGLSTNFKLFTSSLDYSYAKRDVDNRIEKKLAATVKRVF